MLATVLLLGGLLPVGPRTREQWAPSGAWRMPVGDPYHVELERPVMPGPFFLLRGVEWEGSRATHQGADIGCGHAGSLVRAAAAGVVVRVADHGPYGGYGTHIVLAHRLPEGKILYTVYAHLRLGSVRVRTGRTVQAGTALARVGATGRATTPHLHFEVRRPEHAEERWEFARVEDPLEFVDERLPSHRADSSGVGAYLEWAEYAALLAPGARGDDVLTREQWWRMLAAGLKGPMLDLTLPPEQLCDSLVEASVLPERGADLTAGMPMAWSELARDLARVRGRGTRTGSGPLRKAKHRSLLTATFGSEQPLSRLSALSGRSGKPCLTDAVLLFADLAGPQPEPPKPAKPKVAKPTRSAPDTTATRGPVATAKSRIAPKRAGSDSSVQRAGSGAPVAGPARTTKPAPKRSATDSTRRSESAGVPLAGSGKPTKTAPKTAAKSPARPKSDSTSRRLPTQGPLAAPADTS